MQTKLAKVAVRTSLLYAVIAGLWILLSDRLLVNIVSDSATIGRFSMYKGWFFVAVTAVLLYAMLLGQLRRWEKEAAGRMAAEEAVRLAGVYNRSLIEASLDPFVTIDKEGKISDVNAATEQVTGYARSELIGADFSDYFTEPEKARAGYQQVFNQGFVRDYELEIRNRNGEITPVLYNASVYRDNAGNVIGVFAAARDITEQKRAEEARSRLAAIVESSDDAIIGKNLDGTITSWNQGAERLYGYSASEALGRTAFTETPPDQRDEIAVLLSRIREGIRIEHYETERVRKDGRRINVSLTLSPIRDHRGEIIGASTIARDITAQKRAEEALRRSEAYLAEAQRLSHTGSWAFDLASGKFVYASEESHRMYEHDAQEGLPTREATFRLIHPEDRDSVQGGFEKSLREKVDTLSEFRLVLPSGTVKHVQTIRHPVLNEAGDVVELVGTTMDITDRKRAEEESSRLNRELRAISNCNQTLLRTTDEQSLLKEICRIICEEAGYRMAFVAYAEHDEAKSVRPVAWTGAEEGYLATVGITWADTERGRGPAGTAIRSGKTCCIQDFATDPRLAVWREGVLQLGFRSGIALPLKDEHASTFGCLAIYSAQPNAFTSEEIRLLEELAADLEFGIVTLRSRAARKRAEEGVALVSFALDKVREAAFLMDDRGRFQYVNEEACRVLGYSHAELLGLGVADIDPEFPVERWSDHWRDLKTQQKLSFESRHRTREGHIFPVEVSANYFEYGGRVYNLALVRDVTERKQAEDRLRHTAEALQRSEAYLAEAQRLSHTGSWAFDLASNEYVYASEECLRIFELDSQEGLPTREAVSGLISLKDWERVNRDFEKSLREKVDISTEFRIALPSGTAKHVQAIRHPVLNDAGDVVQFVGSVIDITERKRAEEARSRLAAIVESSNDAIVSEDLDGTFTSWNQGAERLYGYSAAEALGRHVSIVLPPDQKDQPLLLTRMREGIRIEQYETERVRKDGRMVHVSLTLSPIRNRQGEIVGASVISRDITERKRAEAEIKDLKNYLSNIIDSMPSILVGLDNARTVTQWNHRAEAFTGIPTGEAIGKPIVDLLPDFAPWIMTMGTDMDEHRPSSMEKLLIEKEGERRFYDLMLYPLLVDAVGGAVLRVEDVTERARIQELMVQTEKMMSIGGLAAGMAHEINNPLGIITQAAQNIERRISLELHVNREVSEELGLNLEGIRAYFDKRQIPDAIASIRTASSRAAKIVANMLQFSRRADTTMEAASLAQILDQALELAATDYDLKKKYDFRSIEIIKDYQDTPQVPIVSVEIEQVILNLLKNAAQAMIANPPDRRPRITFRLRCEDRYAVLKVEDNGPGMTEDTRRRVFEPFFTTKEPGVGTGLGLSVSYMIVTQNHKGLMEVQSTPGSGTVFTVRLPIGGSQT